MERVLRGVPVQPQAASEGVVEAGGDWVYNELSDGSFVRSIGLDEAGPAIAPASAASSP
jgi:hypothetical protein